MESEKFHLVSLFEVLRVYAKPFLEAQSRLAYMQGLLQGFRYDFLTVPLEKGAYFENQKPFGDKVFESFPSSNFDIEEASRCFALERPTAYVFHLMRSMETPLRLLGAELGITDAPNWNKLLQDIEKLFKDIKDQKVSKPVDWKSHRESFYSEASALLRNIKNAWRNETMHLEKKYTPEEALRIFNATKGFMEFLAEHLAEKQDV